MNSTTKFFIFCYKFSDFLTGWTHDYAPSTLEEALRVGHELTRDRVVDCFRVVPQQMAPAASNYYGFSWKR